MRRQLPHYGMTEINRRRALCRIQEPDDHRLVPRDLSVLEVMGVLAAVVAIMGILMLLKIAVG